MRIRGRFAKIASLGIIGASVIVASVTTTTPAVATACITGAGNPVLASDIVNGATWTVCDYRGFNFSGLSGDSIDFSISYLEGAHFVGSTFTNTTIGNNSSHSIDFTNATLTGSSFVMADLSSSDFTNANLTNVNLHFTHLNGANMRGANLTGANLDNVFLADADLTGATVSQSQLAVAVLASTTVCPDGHQLGLHTGDCFSALVALTPELSTPVETSDGFTFDVTNYNELYVFTVSCESPLVEVSMGSPAGTTLPITVANVPQGTIVEVTVTATIGDVAASATTSNAELPNTGLDARSSWLGGGAALFTITLGLGFLLGFGTRTRARKRARS